MRCIHTAGIPIHFLPFFPLYIVYMYVLQVLFGAVQYVVVAVFCSVCVCVHARGGGAAWAFGPQLAHYAIMLLSISGACHVMQHVHTILGITSGMLVCSDSDHTNCNGNGLLVRDSRLCSAVHNSHGPCMLLNRLRN